MRAVRLMVIAVGLLVALDGAAQTPAGAPSGATGRCKDGTFSTEASRVGACHGHQGVRAWYAVPVGTPVPAKETVAPAAGSAPSTVVAAPVAAPAAASVAEPQAAKDGLVSNPPGTVWVNTSTQVYHCAGSRFYGKTKGGKYMPEAEARAMGARVAHGTQCGK